MKRDAKYVWRRGSPPPRLDAHSRVKHRIVESYVRDYILTLMSRATIPRLQLTLVDGFAGGGGYLADNGSGEIDGSPLLMMRAVREARARLNIGRRGQRDVAVDFAFIDVSPDTAAYLGDRIEAHRQAGLIDPVDAAHAKVSVGDFLTHLPRLLTTIKQQKRGERAIFVLDQYGYMLPIPEVARILRAARGAEVLLTFNVGSLVTFLSDRDANRLPLQKIGLEKYIPWDKLYTIKESRQWRQILQRYLAQGIREVAGARFATLFFVRPDRSTPWDYWLIHLSNHYKAHEVMKDLHWDNATVFGHELEPGVFMQGYDPAYDDSYTGQASFDFGESSREACVAGLHEHLGQRIFAHDGPVLLRELVEEWATHSPASTKHFIQSLSQLHRSGDVIVCTEDGKVRRPSTSYHLNSIVEAGRTSRLIP